MLRDAPLFKGLPLVAGLCFALTAGSAPAQAKDADGAAQWEHSADKEAKASEPAKAEADMAKAVALEPDNVKFLKKYAHFASWAGDSAGAEHAYHELVRLNPADYDSLYLMANTMSWQGKTKDAIGAVNTYLVHRPKDKKAMLFLSQLYTWDGDAASAREVLARYRALAGEDKAYTEGMLKLLTGSGDNFEAIAAAREAIARYPGDCDLYTSAASAESAVRQWGPMTDSLSHLGASCTDKAAAAELNGRLSTPLRSSVTGGFSYATDSDTVRIGTFSLNGRYELNPETYLLLGGESGWLAANNGSGFQDVRGNNYVDLYGAWLGAEKMVSDRLWLTGRLGYRGSSDNDGTVVAKASAEYRPTDSLFFSDELGHDLYAVSPRAVSLNIQLTDNTLHGSWRMTPGWSLYYDASYGIFSDGDQRWTGTVSPRYGIVRSEKLNIDLGVSGQVTSFLNPADGATAGYYAPNRYRQFLGNLMGTYAFTPGNTLSVTIDPGIVKDERQSHYGSSGNYSVEGNFGIYSGIMLNPRADFISDLGGAGAGGGGNSSYHRQQYTLNLTGRF